MRGATSGDERCDSSNFSATRRVVTNELEPEHETLEHEVRDTYLPMVAGDNDGACTSLLAFLNEIHLVKTFALVGRLQLLSKIIIANSSSINDGALGEDVLNLYRKIMSKPKFFIREYTHSSSTGGVLSSTSSDVNYLMLRNELVVAVQNKIKSVFILKYTRIRIQ
jgi:hypothetical protein